MSQRFAGKVAIVTGGVSGIGAEISRRFAAEGGSVIAVDINADLVATATEDLGERVRGHVADVTDEAAYAGVIARAIDEYGDLDAVFNVAGGS